MVSSALVGPVPAWSTRWSWGAVEAESRRWAGTVESRGLGLEERVAGDFSGGGGTVDGLVVVVVVWRFG